MVPKLMNHAYTTCATAVTGRNGSVARPTGNAITKRKGQKEPPAAPQAALVGVRSQKAVTTNRLVKISEHAEANQRG